MKSMMASDFVGTRSGGKYILTLFISSSPSFFLFFSFLLPLCLFDYMKLFSFWNGALIYSRVRETHA